MKKICFLTGTRADFGKLKPLMQAVQNSTDYECLIFATGMHHLSRYGLTIHEIYKSGFRNVYAYMNQSHGEPMEFILANTIAGLSRYLREIGPDLLVVHGDRVETLAGAIVGSLGNVRVAHIEGGEVSGTVDEALRHSVSKLAHLHFVANPVAAERLRQMGEDPRSIYVIGSPDIDIMMSDRLPPLEEVVRYYEIPFSDYAVALYHPVTTEIDTLPEKAREFVSALLASRERFVVISPNNDAGCEQIFAAYERLKGNPRFKLLASLRFEYFLTLLREARFLIGNSSAGMREAPAYGVRSINIGSRQLNRFRHSTIINAGEDRASILRAIRRPQPRRHRRSFHFGDGRSTERFMAALNRTGLWATPLQKQFQDLRGRRRRGKGRS